MRLSVVVPAYNEELLLGATLAAIQDAALCFDGGIELIVCDNNSTDGTARIARAAGATVVFEPVNQIARARNAGAAAASGDWLLFVDADSPPGRELFRDLQGAMLGKRCIGGGATVSMDSDDAFARIAVFLWNGVSRLTGWAAGSFVFCRADAFRALGGFSEALYAAEEIEFSRRLKRRGRMTILHRHPLRTSGRKARLYSWREMLGFMLKTVLSGGRTLRRREDCYAWYDGRR